MKPTKDNWYIEYLVRKMHPDLYKDVPASDECVAYTKRMNFCNDLRALADLLEDTVVPLPGSAYFYANNSCFSSYDVKVIVGGKSFGEVDKEATIARLGEIAKAIKPVKKEYEGTHFTLVKELPGGMTFKMAAPRETVCEKRVVERKYVEAVTYPGHYTDVVEWDCNPISLLGDN